METEPVETEVRWAGRGPGGGGGLPIDDALAGPVDVVNVAFVDDVVVVVDDDGGNRCLGGEDDVKLVVVVVFDIGDKGGGRIELLLDVIESEFDIGVVGNDNGAINVKVKLNRFFKI